jgi:hypothetical protein
MESVNENIVITENAEPERYEPPKLKRASPALFMVGSSFLPVFVRATCKDFEKYSSYMDVKKVVHTEDSVTQEKLVFPTMVYWLKVWKHIRSWAVLSCENGHFYSLETCMGIVKHEDMTRAKCPSCRCKIKITNDISCMVSLFKELHQEAERQEGKNKNSKPTASVISGESSAELTSDSEDEEGDSEYHPDDSDGFETDNDVTDGEDEEEEEALPVMMRLVTRRRG